MNVTKVETLLKTNKNELGIQKWNQRYSNSQVLKSYGIGLTVLRKMAKQIGRNHKLALELWQSNIYESKIISVLIDDHKQITREQAELQVEDLKQGHLAHVFSSCGAPLAKTSFVVPLLVDWIESKNTIRQSCGYGLLYELSKSKKKNTPNDDFFLQRIQTINETFQKVDKIVLLSMGGALIGIGKRNLSLNTRALELAELIGPIHFESNSDCEPLDVVKHLTSDYIKNKLGIL